MDAGEPRTAHGLRVPRWGYSESQDCWTVPAWGQGKAPWLGRPRLPQTLTTSSAWSQTILSLFIMFQLGLSVPQTHEACSCHRALCVCHLSTWWPTLHTGLCIYSCFSSFWCGLKSTFLRGLPWLPHPLPHQGKHYLYLSSLCHSPLPESSCLFVYLLRIASVKCKF